MSSATYVFVISVWKSNHCIPYHTEIMTEFDKTKNILYKCNNCETYSSLPVLVLVQ